MVNSLLKMLLINCIMIGIVYILLLQINKEQVYEEQLAECVIEASRVETLYYISHSKDNDMVDQGAKAYSKYFKACKGSL